MITINMLHSITTYVGNDVVLIKRLKQGHVHKFIAIYRVSRAIRNRNVKNLSLIMCALQ